MKLKELKDHFESIQWYDEVLAISFNSNNSLEASFSQQINAEDDISIDYYWYDHMARRWAPKLVRKIENALNKHDFDTFIAAKNQGKDILLPATACVYNLTKDIGLGEILLTAKTFHLITFHEYECG